MAPAVIARSAREQGIVTVGAITKPFAFEGHVRLRIAEEGIEQLTHEVDALIVIPNDRLLQIIDKNTSVAQAFATCDEVLLQAVEGISDLITTPGIINVDFADIRAVLEDAGSALMGIGTATGENRAVEAAKQAINSPLLDLSIEGARGVLFAIAGGDDLSMMEIQEAAHVITESIDPEAKVIFGAIRDEKLKKGQIKITVIASGFGGTQSASKKKGLFAAPLSSPDSKQEIKPTHTSISISQPVSTDMGMVMNRQNKKDDKKEDEDEDDSWAMPAFLRRKK